MHFENGSANSSSLEHRVKPDPGFVEAAHSSTHSFYTLSNTQSVPIYLVECDGEALVFNHTSLSK